MKISLVAIERMYVRELQRSPELRKPGPERPLRVHARDLNDEQLLAKLRSFGFEIDRGWLERNCERALSAEEIAQPLMDQSDSRGLERDWIWICVATLWRRWFPEQPSFEELDDKMQTGYQLLMSNDVQAACRVWLEAWRDVVRLLDKAGIESIADFDERFRGTELLYNWIQDLESELGNAGLEERQFHSARIALCEEGLRRFRSSDELMIENRRRALAESYFELGETEKAEALFREWLGSDPCWGWGWIGWSDCYQFTRTQRVDLNRSEQILREAFAIAAVRGRADIADRLADLSEQQGRDEEAKEFRGQSERRPSNIEVSGTASTAGKVLSQKTQMNFGGAGLPLEEMPNLARTRSEIPATPVTRKKVGRNEPCPCGSGKKFKKCCGA